VDGHPLPGSREARHDEIPEDMERRKGLGDDEDEPVQPEQVAVNPDGEPYPTGGKTAGARGMARDRGSAGKGARPGGDAGGSDMNRRAGDGAPPSRSEIEFGEDQRAHQDQGQSDIERDG
jgi:hypothetical protein